MRDGIDWWVLDPRASAVVRRIARPSRSLVFRWVRELRGLDGRELAELTGLRVSTIEALEHGRYVPSQEHLERLVVSLGISPETLEDFVALVEGIRGGAAGSNRRGEDQA